MGRDELIAALEAATGPDRELDVTIHKTIVGLRQYESIFWECGSPCLRYFPGPPGPEYASLPQYTASPDAALTLVPEEYWWAAGDCKRESHASVGLEGGSNDTIYDTSGATPPNVAIALCIVAIKARAA